MPSSLLHQFHLCLCFWGMCPDFVLFIVVTVQVHEPKDEEIYSDKPYIGKEGLEA